jgi:predicted dehydrogenase
MDSLSSRFHSALIEEIAAMSTPKTVRLGFVGAGYMGQLAHIENYWKMPGVELVALAEGRPKTAALVARTYGIAETYGHHSEMLRKANLDAVVAILPFSLNAEVVEDALNAGKHVITEKPQVNTSPKGHELIALAKKKNVIYQVGYMKRFDPGVRWAKAKIAEWKASGVYGPMIAMRIWCSHGSWNWFREPVLNAGDDAIQYPSKLEAKTAWMAEDTWNWNGHQGWTNYYSHQTNLARYVAGEDYKLEYAKRMDQPSGRSHLILCDFEQSHANLLLEFTGHRHNHWDEGFEVRFPRATLHAKVPAPLASRQASEIRAYEFPEKGEARETKPFLEPIDGFAAQARQFIACIRGEEQPLSPASDAVKEVEFSEALMKVYQDQKK